ncbi:MAG: 7-cyano-7-deazaguanine synthase QueC [Sedimentisphaerales bacterium]|jgi:7-cyano-7-deazaguanine synthase|nr:7-cyano-7-deazaguanine synthase QueC [Sedimentisphaerales bacterium]
MAKAVVLLSGGLDSATVLAIARHQGFECHALTCLYGQRHGLEVEAARQVARSLDAAEHLVIRVDLGAIGGSALTDWQIHVPDGPAQQGVPITYVPARNTVLLALALAWAEAIGAFDIFIGVHAVDAGGYPDCRQAFIQAFEDLANVATAAAVQGLGRFRIHAPLINMTKAQIIRKGLELGVDYRLTRSCYRPDPKGRSCGRCLACRVRLDAFAELGLEDGIPYTHDHAGS